MMTLAQPPINDEDPLWMSDPDDDPLWLQDVIADNYQLNMLIVAEGNEEEKDKNVSVDYIIDENEEVEDTRTEEDFYGYGDEWLYDDYDQGHWYLSSRERYDLGEIGIEAFDIDDILDDEELTMDWIDNATRYDDMPLTDEEIKASVYTDEEIEEMFGNEVSSSDASNVDDIPF